MTNGSTDEAKIVVLVADDEPSTVAMVASHLRAKGYDVLEASDGDHAWQLAHENLPDLVVLDVMMPGMSGWEVCRKIREAVSLAHTGVVMLTGIGENLNEMTSPLYGADAHVDKPFEFSDLDARIEETLERRRDGAIGRGDAEEDGETTIERPTLPAAGAKQKGKRAASSDAPDAPDAPKPPVKARPSGAKRASSKALEEAALEQGEARSAGRGPRKTKAVEKPTAIAKAKARGKAVLAKIKEVAEKAMPSLAKTKPAKKVAVKKAAPVKAAKAPAKAAKAKAPAKAAKAPAKAAKTKAPAKAAKAPAKAAKAKAPMKAKAPAKAAKAKAPAKAKAANAKTPAKAKAPAKAKPAKAKAPAKAAKAKPAKAQTKAVKAKAPAPAKLAKKAPKAPATTKAAAKPAKGKAPAKPKAPAKRGKAKG